MRKLLPLLGACLAVGCLSPGAPLYLPVDDVPPTIASIEPPMGADAGRPSINPGQFIDVTFSEQMDLGSLRPGIVIRNKDRIEQALNLQVDPDQIRGVTAADRDFPMTVHVSSAVANGFPSGPYQLILRTLLIDQQGNALAAEFLGTFDVN